LLAIVKNVDEKRKSFVEVVLVGKFYVSSGKFGSSLKLCLGC
jgi:hypothetical protein